MESTDRQILALLEADGRMSWTDLGRETGLSTSAAQQRVKRLEAKGVIKGYRAVLDLEAIGAGITAFIFIVPVDPDQDDLIPAELSRIPEVRGCHSIAGSASYLVRVQTRTPTELDVLLTRIRKSCHCSTETIVVLDTLFDDLDMLGDRRPSNIR
uniref:Lrp/AsnC family transcriptional regulator n=1 Tax=Acidipropionibacterium timonense TaxID=2161818 RepID=UPI0010323465